MLAHYLLLVQSPLDALAWPAKADKVAKSQGVSFKQEAGKIEVSVDGQPFTTYYFEGFNKPVFFPLRAASGTIVTRGYPMVAGVAGEAQDHPHHKGLWFTHGDVNGVDFWSESDKTGKIVHRRFAAVKGGSKTGVLQSENDWVTPAGETVLKEIREVTIHSQPGVRVMDFDLKVTALAGSVKFGDTKEGSFGIRLAQPFSDKNGGRIENSQGGQGEKGCWGKSADLGRLHHQDQWRARRRGHFRSPDQFSSPEPLARSRLLSFRGESLWPARFLQRQSQRWQPYLGEGTIHEFSLPDLHSSRQRARCEDWGPVQSLRRRRAV
jgi:hypothetical protein